MKATTMFQVALTADFFDAHGKLKYADVGLSTFDDQPQIALRPFAEHRPIVGADQLRGAHGVIVMTPRITRESLAGADDLLSVGRFGVGYDSVDVAACTAADILVVITVGAVDRSVAEATVGWMLALSLHVNIKDRLGREARWDDRSRYMGRELRDRTLGIVGLGGIGRQLVQLLHGWSLREIVAFDPLVDPTVAMNLGVRLVGLDELLRSSDFVSIHCPLNDQTRGLIGARELGLMKPDAYLINTARGGIVDEDALYDALQQRRIAGAAIDCFVEEPYTQPSRFREFENVLLAPHCIAWTNEIFRDMGRAACQGMIDLSLGRRPRGIVNPQVLDSAGFIKKWQRVCDGSVANIGESARYGSLQE
jgi:phosphoglycerate dehydrogenase-like enzyme